MLTITMRDLVFRWRQFFIAVVGAGLVFAMALLLTGLAEGFRSEVHRTVEAVGADNWVVPRGSSGPFTSFGALPGTATKVVAGLPGVTRADPLLIVPATAVVGGSVRSVRLFGHVLEGVGTPRATEGRAVTSRGEVVVDARTGLGLGATLTLGGIDLSVVGRVTGHTLLGGVPNVYVSIVDAQEIAFGGADLITTVVTTGTPTNIPHDLRLLTNAEVKADTVHAMKDAIASIDNSRVLMWVVAGVIVAALMYVSALERLRDFAVLKSLGSSSPLLFAGVATQAIVVALLAALFALVASRLMRPMFPLPTTIPGRAYLVLPIVAVVVGLLSSLVALRRAISIDPAAALTGQA